MATYTLNNQGPGALFSLLISHFTDGIVGVSFVLWSGIFSGQPSHVSASKGDEKVVNLAWNSILDDEKNPCFQKT